MPLTCLSDFIDQRREEEGRGGGPGHVRALQDDGVPPGPGEAEEEERTDRVIRRRLLMMEETILRSAKKGGEEGEGKGREGH